MDYATEHSARRSMETGLQKDITREYVLEDRKRSQTPIQGVTH